MPVKLKDITAYFEDNRKGSKLLVSAHAWKDHPNRGFTHLEIVDLVKNGRGSLRLNKAASAIPDSVVLHVKDKLGRNCELVLLITEEANVIKVCSAWRGKS